MHAEGEGEGEMYWEIRLDIDTLPYVEEIASGNLRYCSGSSAQCSGMT